MIHVRLSPALNFQFGAFSVLVLLTLICSCRGQTQVIGPTRPIVATVGEDVVLQSFLDPVMDAFSMTVEWTRPDLDPRFVFVWRDGVELESKKNPLYEGRTSVFTDELKVGNISLKLSRVRISDEGRYRCFIPALNKDHVVQLVVGAASSPVIQKTKDSSRVVLQCNSTGWYPEPEVFWLDGEGNLLSAGPTETVRGPDDLYTVSSRVTVEKRHSNSFTCRVQQNHINQIRETHIHVPDDFFPVQSSSSSTTAGLVVSLAVCILVILILGFYVWRQEKTKTKRIHRDETGEGEMNQEGEGLVTKVDGLKDKINQLTEEKKRSEEERQELQTNKEQMEKQLQDQQQKAAEAQRELEQKLNDEKKLGSSLSSQVVSLTAEVNKLTEEKKKSEEERQKLQTKITEMEKQLQDQQQKAAGAQREVDGLKDKINQLTEEKKSSEEERQQLQTNKEQLEKQLNEEKKLGSSLSSQVVSLTAEVNKLTEEKKSEEERQKMEKQLQDQQQKAAGAQRELQEEKKKREEEVQGKNQELQEKTDQVDGLEDEVDQLTEEKKRSEEEQQELQTNKEQYECAQPSSEEFKENPEKADADGT